MLPSIGAKFTLEVDDGQPSNFTWAADANWVSVTDGVVTFTGTGSGDKVTITGTPTNGQGDAIKYSFTLKAWFITRGTGEVIWSDANSYCNSQSGFHLPSGSQLTNDGNSGVGTQTRAIGNLWSEWGTEPAEDVSRVWTTDAGDYTYKAYVNLIDGRLVLDTYTSKNEVVCRKGF